MTQIIDLPPELVHLMEEVNQCMLNRISVLPGQVYDIIAPSIIRGKRVRGLLVLLSGLNAGASKELLIPVAAAFELLHFATLVHDDIVDEHQERRGNPALHTMIPTPAAVLTADVILSISLSIISETKNLVIIDSTVRVLEQITEAELNVHLNERNISFSREKYFNWIKAKTASLFKICAFSGAILQRVDEDLSFQHSRIGELLGLAFQIKDDILDYTNHVLLCRSPGCDLRSGLVTLPLIWYHDTGGISPELEDWIQGNRENTDIQSLLTNVGTSGALIKSQQEAETYGDMAVKIVQDLPSERMKKPLMDLCRYAVLREQ
ncbi:MAG: hypothetical protein GXY48_08395 [Methanomicrobiales archaeon]|nr:hypothetical protein [Methanomicrobiales archaeon]